MPGFCAGDAGTEPGLFGCSLAAGLGPVPRRGRPLHRTHWTLPGRAITTGFCVMSGRPMRVVAGSVPSHKLLYIWCEASTSDHVFLKQSALHRTLSILLRGGTEPKAFGRGQVEAAQIPMDFTGPRKVSGVLYQGPMTKRTEPCEPCTGAQGRWGSVSLPGCACQYWAVLCPS